MRKRVEKWQHANFNLLGIHFMDISFSFHSFFRSFVCCGTREVGARDGIESWTWHELIILSILISSSPLAFWFFFFLIHSSSNQKFSVCLSHSKSFSPASVWRFFKAVNDVMCYTQEVVEFQWRFLLSRWTLFATDVS